MILRVGNVPDLFLFLLLFALLVLIIIGLSELIKYAFKKTICWAKNHHYFNTF